jgi:hypothetical protein
LTADNIAEAEQALRSYLKGIFPMFALTFASTLEGLG